jgi:DNA-binding PadR family transcriptional regulator
MEESGWVASHIGKESRGPQRRVYQLQPEGKNYLDELVDGLRRRRDEINNLLQTYDQELK